MNTSTSPITMKWIDWFNRTWLGLFTLKIVLMIILEKCFLYGSILVYILSLFLLIATKVLLGTSIFKRKTWFYLYIVGLSIFLININISINKRIYYKEFCSKEYSLVLERKHNNLYEIINSNPINNNLCGTIVRLDKHAKYDDKLISVSCQLVSSDSTILLKNARVYNSSKGFWGTIKDFLTERFPNNSHGTLACAIILGDSRLIEQSEIKSFQEAGVLHLFAVSGLHVGFMYILVRQVCSILFFKNIFCEILGILSAGIYVMVVGFPDSAIRAWLMLFLFLLFSMLQRKKNSMNSLLVSGLIILFIDGESLFSVGFQMSYTIVTGIVWVFKSNTTKGFNKSLFSYCLSIFKLTITCSFASSLLLIDYFNHFPAFSFITNFLLQPIIFLFFSISFFSIFIHINILSYILEYIQLYVFWICDYFATINSKLVGVIALDLHNSIHLILFASFLFSYHLKLNLNHRFLIISSFYILTFFVFVILPI